MERIVVDLDADPVVPQGYKLIESAPGGQWEFDPAGLELCLASGQIHGNCSSGYDIGDLVLSLWLPANACLFDFFEEHPELIPASWADEYGLDGVVFWSSFFMDEGGKEVFVACIRWDDMTGEPYFAYTQVDNLFSADEPALIIC